MKQIKKEQKKVAELFFLLSEVKKKAKQRERKIRMRFCFIRTYESDWKCFVFWMNNLYSTKWVCVCCRSLPNVLHSDCRASASVYLSWLNARSDHRRTCVFFSSLYAAASSAVLVCWCWWTFFFSISLNLRARSWLDANQASGDVWIIALKLF